MTSTGNAVGMSEANAPMNTPLEALERLKERAEATRDCSVCDGDGKVQRHDPPYGLRDCGGCAATGVRHILDGSFRSDLRSLLTSYEAQGERLREVEGRAERYESVLRECYRDYSHPNFTDRHDMAGTIRAALTQPPAMEKTDAQG